MCFRVDITVFIVQRHKKITNQIIKQIFKTRIIKNLGIFKCFPLRAGLAHDSSILLAVLGDAC